MDVSYQRLEKDSNSAIALAPKAAGIPPLLAPPGSLRSKQLHHLRTQSSLGQSCQKLGTNPKSTVSPAPMTPGSPAYLVLPGSLKPKQLHHLQPGTHWGRPKSSSAASGVNSCGRSTFRGGDKATVECQGNVANKKNRKSSHQLYKMKVKSTQADSLSIEYIKGQ